MRGHLVLLTALLLALTPAWSQSLPDMLNVQELGASGSQFQTTAATTAGSNTITVADPGDFKVGQGVMISRCNIQFSRGTLWGPKAEYLKSAPLKDLVQIRGYDGSLGSWTVYIIDLDGAKPATFRFSDDLGRTWKQSKVPITGDWQPLSGGTEVKFAKFDWDAGYAVTFSARDQLITTIEKIEGKTITLKEAAGRTAADAVVRHNDTEALQAAIDRGIAEKRNLYFPPGTYRLARSLRVEKASGLTIEGSDGVNTILDISEGEGACFELRDGREVTVRNFRMLGNTGFDARDQAGVLRLNGARNVWGFYLKPCHGLTVTQTERVLVENCHASKMSGECFYSSGRSRVWNQPEPAQYTKSLTWLRCSVTDSARNAFNNNDMAENTSVLQCRIVDVGGCTWEGASRFVRFIGNYVRNAGTVAMGNVRSRDERYEQLGTGQHIVADNVFEGTICYGGAAIRAAGSASQVIIRDNLFVNFNSSAIDISGLTGERDLPAGISTISGNIMDFTDVSGKPAPRTAILITAPSVIVSDNQIYVRGAADPQVTALKLCEPARELQVHDNQVRNCGAGLLVTRAASRVAEVTGPGRFRPAANSSVPFERRQSPRYRGWQLVWLRDGKPAGRAIVQEFDPETRELKLLPPANGKPAATPAVGDPFELYAPAGPSWQIHDNTFSGCLQPLTLDGYGGDTAVLRHNIVTREPATGVKEAVVVKGRYTLVDNEVSGFDEPGAATLSLYPDRFGKAPANLYEGNTFQRCALPVQEAVKGLWQACRGSGNTFLDCAVTPAPLAAPVRNIVPVLREVAKPAPAVLKASRPAKPIKLDGLVAEWPWSDAARTGVLQQTPDGQPYPGSKSSLQAACDSKYLYLAMKIALPKGYQYKVGTGQYDGDGLEVAFRSAEPAAGGGIFVLWGGVGGNFSPVSAGGATPAQMEALAKGVTYAAARGAEGWSCEWRIPLSVFGPKPPKKLSFNTGIDVAALGAWVAWVGTGAEIFRVDGAGSIILQP